jgi:hypothetical protein
MRKTRTPAEEATTKFTSLYSQSSQLSFGQPQSLTIDPSISLSRKVTTSTSNISYSLLDALTISYRQLSISSPFLIPSQSVQQPSTFSPSFISELQRQHGQFVLSFPFIFIPQHSDGVVFIPLFTSQSSWSFGFYMAWRRRFPLFPSDCWLSDP